MPHKFNGLQALEQRFKSTVPNRIISWNLAHRGVDAVITRVLTSTSAQIHTSAETARDVSQDAFDVYGTHSGLAPDLAPRDTGFGVEEELLEFPARVLITKFLLNPIDAANAGALEQIVIYSEADLKPGDRVTWTRSEGSKCRGIIGQLMSHGLTTDVYHYWELNNIADCVS